ncbi:MAG TPA: hypothetical protein VFX56_02155 [Nitrospira sp.]|nr:hypothetical protein [Nitrospira sp.]
MAMIVRLWLRPRMTFGKKIGAPTGGKIAGWNAEKIDVRIGGLIEERIVSSRGVRIAEKIVVTTHGPMLAELCEGSIVPIMSLASMGGKGGRMPVRPKWTDRTGRSGSKESSGTSVWNDRIGLSGLNDWRDRNAPSGLGAIRRLCCNVLTRGLYGLR